MSNAGQALSAFAGAVIGFVASGFNPAGAITGFNAGMEAGPGQFERQLVDAYAPTYRGVESRRARRG